MSDRKISEITKALIAARKLIENRATWCQGSERQIFLGDQEPRIQFCSLGALRAASPELAARLYTLLSAAISGGDLIKYNDSHSHSEVLAVWDAMIAKSIDQDQEHSNV